MTDFNLDAMRALVQATELAQQNVTDTACEGCTDGAGQAYLFHYARITDHTTTLLDGQTQRETTTYADISARAVMLCAACVTQYQQAMRKEWTLKLLAGLIPAIIGIIGVALTSGSTQTLIGAPTVLFGVWAMGCGFMLNEFSELPKCGSKFALSLHQEALERDGFDSFWDKLDIEAMRSEIAAFT